MGDGVLRGTVYQLQYASNSARVKTHRDGQGRQLYFDFRPHDLSAQDQIFLANGAEVEFRRLTHNETVKGGYKPLHLDWIEIVRVVLSLDKQAEG